MASNSETGYAKNTGNLLSMITIFTDMGPLYVPTNSSSALLNLQSIHASATAVKSEVNNLAALDTIARANRVAVVNPISKELTGLRKAYKATSGVTNAQLDDFDAIVRKFRGLAKYKKPSIIPDAKEHSSAHTSYDQRANTLGELLALLTNTPNYNPNEAKFKVAYWQDVQDNLLTATKNVNEAYAPLALARTRQDDIFDKAEGNLVDTANAARTYGLSIVPSGSTVYKALIRLKFTKH